MINRCPSNREKELRGGGGVNGGVSAGRPWRRRRRHSAGSARGRGRGRSLLTISEAWMPRRHVDGQKHSGLRRFQRHEVLWPPETVNFCTMCFGQGKRSYGALRQQTLPYRELAENIQVTYIRERKCLRPRFVVWDLPKGQLQGESKERRHESSGLDWQTSRRPQTRDGRKSNLMYDSTNPTQAHPQSQTCRQCLMGGGTRPSPLLEPKQWRRPPPRQALPTPLTCPPGGAQSPQRLGRPALKSPGPSSRRRPHRRQ